MTSSVELERLSESHRRLVRAQAELVARRFATVLSEMASDEFKTRGNTEARRALRDRAKTAAQIADMISGISLRDEDVSESPGI